MIVYLLYGAQGSGKTTQAELLAKELNLTLVSTGQISRDIASQDTPEGRKVKELIDKGEPTPGEVIVPAVDKMLDNPGSTAGFVFDGYPRFIEQVEPLVSSLDRRGWEITRVIKIDLLGDEQMKRITLRAKNENRSDDTPAAVTRRLDLYRQQTEPIISYFRRIGKLVEVDGGGSVEEVHQLILGAISKNS